MTPESDLIDIGCGSGRLAVQLVNYLISGSYIGIDIVPELHEYAKKLCQVDNFNFYNAPGLVIHSSDCTADMICFFSVMTHLTHKESYLYLKDAKRVLKHDGKIIISFLESIMRGHPKVFEQYVETESEEEVLCQFIERSNFKMWCDILNLRIDKIYSGKENYIKIDRPLEMNGKTFYHHSTIGQSTIVLSKV